MARLTAAAARCFARKIWTSKRMSELQFDILVVGAGPAGLAAACAAAETRGRGHAPRVALVDETPWPGGQIWRGEQAISKHSSAKAWFARFGRSGSALMDRTCVIAAPEPGLLLAERDGQPLRIRWETLI